MIDMQNQEEIPILEDFEAYIRNPVFMQFCSEIKKKYRCNEKIEFSRCSWERGWNVKFKKPVYRISQGRIFYGTGCGWRKRKRSS